MSELIKSEILTAQNHLDCFNSNQLKLWNFLYPDPSNITPLDRNHIEPTKLIKFLRNLWMADLVYQPDGEITELAMRLIGTGLVPHYGEVTGEHLIDENGLTDFQTKHPAYHTRLTNISSELVRKNTPLLVVSAYKSEDEIQTDGTALVFPMCRDSEHMNMVFGYTELTTSKAGVKIV